MRQKLSIRLFQPFVCPQCQIRPPAAQSRRALSTSSVALAESTNPGSTLRYAHLKNRGLIRLAGPDAAQFLHNIVPAKVLGSGTSPVYTAFLSAQGRILNDVFIYPPLETGDGNDEWFIEVDSESAESLMKHLKKHKLRAKFQLERVPAGVMGVYYRWPRTGLEELSDQGRTGPKRTRRVGGPDPRPGMGIRWLDDVSGKSETVQRVEDSGGREATIKDYTIHRMLNGVAEGQSELISSSALPQESNIDFFGGIDFHKGCYLGQELTIRTHHTGVVRKRILPCQLYDENNRPRDDQPSPEYHGHLDLPMPPSQSNISKLSSKVKGRSSGKWLGGVGNIGLALCRLEMMTDIQLTADRTGYDPEEEYKVQWESDGSASAQKEIRLRPFVPTWLREGVEQSLRRKERSPKKKDEDGEEEV